MLVLINFSLSLQGVYVLTDSSFRPFARMSMAVRAEAVTMAQAVRIPARPWQRPVHCLCCCADYAVHVVPLVPVWHHPRRARQSGH